MLAELLHVSVTNHLVILRGDAILFSKKILQKDLTDDVYGIKNITLNHLFYLTNDGHFCLFEGALSGLRQFLAIIPPQKLFSFSRYLSFCFDFLVMSQNGLIRRKSLISNFMTS